MDEDQTVRERRERKAPGGQDEQRHAEEDRKHFEHPRARLQGADSGPDQQNHSKKQQPFLETADSRGRDGKQPIGRTRVGDEFTGRYPIVLAHHRTHGVESQAVIRQHLRGDAALLAQDPGEQVLDANVGIVPLTRFGHRELDAFLGA